MIKHIIMFRFHDKKWKEKNQQRVVGMIEKLGSYIPAVKHIEAGINISLRDIAYDIILVSDFSTEDNLEAYLIHPEHKKLVEFLSTTDYDRAVVDYKY